MRRRTTVIAADTELHHRVLRAYGDPSPLAPPREDALLRADVHWALKVALLSRAAVVLASAASGAAFADYDSSAESDFLATVGGASAPAQTALFTRSVDSHPPLSSCQSVC